MNSYIYLIQDGKYIDTNGFKIGRTTQKGNDTRSLSRIKSYSKNTIQKFVREVPNDLVIPIETIIKGEFSKKYKLVCGTEWFEGNVSEMVRDVIHIIENINLDIEENTNDVEIYEELMEEQEIEIEVEEVFENTDTISSNDKVTFICEFCEKSFNKKYNLQVHQEKACRGIFVEKQKKDSYQCDYCDKVYSTYSNCSKHMRLYHSHQLNNEQQDEKNTVIDPINIQYNHTTIHNYQIIEKKEINIFKIYSIPDVNDKSVYSDEYCQKVKEMCHMETITDDSNIIHFFKIFMNYIEHVYFNDAFPENFSFLYYKMQEGKILMKDDEQWNLVDQNEGLQELFKNAYKNFSIFITYFRTLPWIHNEIQRHNTNHPIVKNYFNGSLDRFLMDLVELKNSEILLKKTKQNEDNLTSNAQNIYKKFTSQIKLLLLEKQKVMKQYYELDKKRGSTNLNHFLKEHELEEHNSMKMKLEKKKSYV